MTLYRRDGMCSACHHREHDPGSCHKRCNCEWHTDEPLPTADDVRGILAAVPLSVAVDCPYCFAFAELGDEHRYDCPEVMASWSVATWGQFVDAINNGLGWAEEEGMAHDFGSRPSIVAAVLLLIAAYRSTSGTREP